MSGEEIADIVAERLLKSERYLEALMQEAPLGAGTTKNMNDYSCY